MAKIYGSNTINESRAESAQILSYSEYTPLSTKLRNKSYDILSGNMFTSWSENMPKVKLVPIATVSLNVTITVPDTRDEDLIRKKYPLGYMSMVITGVTNFSIMNEGKAALKSTVLEDLQYIDKDSGAGLVLSKIQKINLKDAPAGEEQTMKLNWSVKGVGETFKKLNEASKTGKMSVNVEGTILGNFAQDGKKFFLFPVSKISSYANKIIASAIIQVSGYNVTYIRSKNF